MEPSDPDDESERRFIERLRARDERAFLELVQLYQGRVYKLVFRMVGRRDEAEDLAQEVFVQVFKAVGNFRGDSRLGTWVYTIAVNLCKNRLKYLGRRKTESQADFEPLKERLNAEEVQGFTSGDVERPDQMAEGREVERIVRLCLAEMDPDFREVLVLRDLEDLSYEELSEITGLPDGTVKSRLHRARAMLKSAVERKLGGKS
ncbi:MAG: sigma-70 family RNA polymerase sigma factor [Myxococcota bacterium]|nr:sigma-70 family RNA polymerase sigma factor [Myxococcota bacterium]